MAVVDWARIWLATRLAFVVALGISGLVVIPDVYPLIPAGARAWWAEFLVAVSIAAGVIVRELAAFGPGERGVARGASRILAFIRSLCRFAIAGKGLVAGLTVVCVWLCAGWVPHYLTWPYSRDADTFAVLAQSWNAGILPYRDIRAYNFPGETYLFWILGTAFGWGNTVPFYAVDAGCVVFLGVALVAWSHRRLGGPVPGLVAYISFLQFYMNMSFENVAERDWHAAFLVSLALLALQTFAGRWPRVLSALATAIAFSIRPHALLFLPALVRSAIDQKASAMPNKRGDGRAGLEWCLWLFAFVAALFVPLVWYGIADDMVRGLRVVAYGGPYNKATPRDSLVLFLNQFTLWRVSIPFLATLVLSSLPGQPLRGLARSWLLAFLGALVYRPIHPVHHYYLIHPILLVSSICWALPLSWLIAARTMARPIVLLAIVLLTYEIMPTRPYMSSLRESYRALYPLAAGEMPRVTPPGCVKPFPRMLPGNLGWNGYREVLRYIRERTSKHTYVANVLNRYPYEALNGQTGRLSPFRAESGICWMSWVDIDLDAEFARELEETPDSVVVWVPSQVAVDPRLRLEHVKAVIRKYYEPAVPPIGRSEIWKRKPASAARFPAVDR